MPSVGNPNSQSAPWLAANLLPEASLGGEPGVWRGKSELMSLTDIAAQLREQKAEEKAPIHWVEVPNTPRVVHISEVPELWEAQTERDLRHAQTAIKSHRTITLLVGGGSVTVLAFGAPRKLRLCSQYSASSRRRLGSRPPKPGGCCDVTRKAIFTGVPANGAMPFGWAAIPLQRCGELGA